MQNDIIIIGIKRSRWKGISTNVKKKYSYIHKKKYAYFCSFYNIYSHHYFILFNNGFARTV